MLPNSFEGCLNLLNASAICFESVSRMMLWVLQPRNQFSTSNTPKALASATDGEPNCHTVFDCISSPLSVLKHIPQPNMLSIVNKAASVLHFRNPLSHLFCICTLLLSWFEPADFDRDLTWFHSVKIVLVRIATSILLLLVSSHITSFLLHHNVKATILVICCLHCGRMLNMDSTNPLACSTPHKVQWYSISSLQTSIVELQLKNVCH